MSKLTDKILHTIIMLTIIAMFLLAFKELLITDESVSQSFQGLMETLPFAKLLTKIVSKILEYQYKIRIITNQTLLNDFVKLAVMACIQPWMGKLTSTLFLKLPNVAWYDREKYMDSVGYKIKSAIISALTTPFIAIIASYATECIMSFFVDKFGNGLSIGIGILIIIVIIVISIIPLIGATTTFAFALVWRLAVTLLAKMVTTFFECLLCFGVYITILKGVSDEIIISILILFVMLAVMDFGIECLKYGIVGKFYK